MSDATEDRGIDWDAIAALAASGETAEEWAARVTARARASSLSMADIEAAMPEACALLRKVADA